MTAVNAANRCYAYFGISGSFDPDEITRQVGTQPSRAWREGTSKRGTSLKYSFSQWNLNSRLANSATLEEHIADVLTQMDANASAFEKISQAYEGTMELVAEFRAGYPGLVLDRAIVRRLADYGLQVDCDFYWLNDD